MFYYLKGIFSPPNWAMYAMSFVDDIKFDLSGVCPMHQSESNRITWSKKEAFLEVLVISPYH